MLFLKEEIHIVLSTVWQRK